MFLIYDFIFFIYSLIYLPYALFTGRLYQGFEQRFGFLPDLLQQDKRPAIWVHAVSVGEVMLGESFIKHLQQKYPGYRIVFSVTTKTGFALAQQRLSAVAQVIAAPLDFSFVTASFVRAINPKIYIVLETEIWPNLFAQLHARQIPIVIINGRISDKSFPRYQLIKGLLKGILSKVNLLCMQSQLDVERIITLGADAAKVQVMGNIKFDHLPKGGEDPIKADLGEGPWWICGSTHSGEEEIILDAYKKLLVDYPQWRLVIAPRHVERADEVMALIGQKGFKAIKWTQFSSEVDAAAVVVVDAIGHLRSLYSKASLVFVGKSLCGGGGQNIIEPAVFAKPIIVGPMMENFRDIMACFNNEGAIIQVSDAAEFGGAVKDLMGSELKRLELGRRARAVIEANQGVGARTMAMLEPFLS